MQQLIRFCLILGLMASSTWVGADIELEYKIKALYITRLAEFIDWPESNQQKTFTICIDSDDKIYQHLIQLHVEEVLSKPLKIIKTSPETLINDCHFLYQSDGAIKQALKELPVFTLSSQDDFAKHGGMIEFCLEKNKVKMKANLTAVKQAGLKISSKLYKLIQIVQPLETDNNQQ